MAFDPLPDLSKYTDFAKDMESKYQNKYAYRIGGKDDDIYKSLTKAIKDESQQGILKSKRTKTVAAVKVLNAGGSAVQDIDAAKERIKFVKEALTALKKVTTSGDATSVASAVKTLSRELSDAAEQYLQGRYDGAPNTSDASFINQVKDLQKQLTNIGDTQKNRLAGENKFFDSGLASAKLSFKKLTNTLSTISLLPAPIAATTGGGGADTGDGVDITV